ncbi:hypothetical protein ScPMuIL_000275 [Solemya velum]
MRRAALHCGEENGVVIQRKMRPQRKRQTIVARECLARDADLGFIVEEIPPKGRGVRTTIRRSKGDFLMIYPGELITEAEGEKRKEKDPSVFRYFFHHKREGWCMDATSEADVGPRLGRLVNHGRKDGNCVMKILEFNRRPYLCLFAARDISESEELLYDYGINDLPWEIDDEKHKKTKNSRRLETVVQPTIDELPDDRPHGALVQHNIDELPDDRPHGALVQPTIDELPDDRPRDVLVQPTIDELPDDRPHGALVQHNIDELPDDRPLNVLVQPTIDELPDDRPHDALVQHNIDELPDDRPHNVLVQHNTDELPDDRPHDVLVQPTIDELPDDRPHDALVQPTIDELPDDRPHDVLVQPTIDELPDDRPHGLLVQHNIDELPDDRPHGALVQPTIDELPDDRPHGALVQPTIDELPDDRPHSALVQPTIDELPDDRPHSVLVQHNIDELPDDRPHGALVQPTIDELSYVLAQSTIDELSYVLAQSTIDKLPDDCPHDAEPPETNDNPTEDRDCFARQECTEQYVEDSVDEDTCSDISTVWPELSCQNPSGFVLCPSTGEFVMATGHEQIYSKEESMDGFPELAETHLESLPYISTKQSAQVRKVYRRNGHRLYDKALACYFCEKVLHHRIQKHLKHCHKNENIVAEALAKSSKTERDNKMKKIKNLGAFKYNLKVIASGRGNLIVARRPSKKTLTVEQFLPCLYCYGFFYKKELWRHTRSCPLKTNKSEKQQQVISRSKLLLLGGLTSCSVSNKQHIPIELQETVFRKIRKDDVYNAIENDSLIVSFGQVLINQLGSRRTNHISQRMRQLGRLKMKLNEIKKQDQDIQHYISPQHFDTVILAVKDLAGFRRNEEHISVFDTPSLALTFGHNLVKVAELKRGIAIRSTDDVMKRESNDFLQLHSTDWAHLISSVALATLKTNKFNKPMALPVTKDLVTLKKYLDEQMENLTNQLLGSKDSKIWKSLAEVTLTRVILFNKRRSSEVAKLLSTIYKKRSSWTQSMNEEISSGLKPVEKLLLKRLQLVETQGKQNKKCPILLTELMVAAIDTLEKTRADCSIETSNPYVFASSVSKDCHINAWQAMNKLAHEAGCEQPNLVSSSRLRKYLATVCQILDLEDFELEWLSRHLAHDINTHKMHYRQHDAAVEIAKVGSLMMAADAGQIRKFAGKKLSEINVSELIVPVEEMEEEEEVHKDVDMLDEELTEMETSSSSVSCQQPNIKDDRKTAVSRKRKRTVYRVQNGSDDDDDVMIVVRKPSTNQSRRVRMSQVMMNV